MTLSNELLQILACPQCKGELTAADGFLECPACRLRFPVRDGIPILLVEEAEKTPR